MQFIMPANGSEWLLVSCDERAGIIPIYHITDESAATNSGSVEKG